MLNKIVFTTLLIAFVASLTVALPALAQVKVLDQMEMTMDDGSVMVHSLGPTIVGKMLHAWVSLFAAIIIFVLALKFMTGGQLSRPIMLMGFGALGDAVIGLTSTPANHLQNMWIGSLIFSLAVVIAILWIGKIFGAFKMPAKKEISQPSQPDQQNKPQ